MPRSATSERRAKPLSGFTQIILATIVAGIAGYVVTWFVPRVIGGGDYKVFAVFWAAMYLVVGALSGIQQEVTRGSREKIPGGPASGPARASHARNFGLAAAAAVVVLILATAPMWVHAVFPELGWQLVLPLAFGTASYVLVATLSGTLYGLTEWGSIALLIVTDGLLRLIAVVIVAVFTHSVVALAWAAACPFILALPLLWLRIRPAVVGRIELDVGFRRLSWNVGRTVGASVSAAALVSGFPLLLSLTSPHDAPAVLASLFLAITLTRAPLIVSVTALQGYLLVRFRDHPLAFRRTFLQIISVIVGGAAVLSALAFWLAPAVFALLFPGEPGIGAGFFAVLVGSSALVAALSVTAAAVLARAQHAAYSIGWFVAAAATILTLLTNFDLVTRTGLSLVAGPVCGLLVHAVFLAIPARKDVGTSESGTSESGTSEVGTTEVGPEGAAGEYR